MQGKKHYQEKFFVNFRLSERIPEGNFYRRLKETLDLEYLRALTAKHYGSEGQKSIDPVVFFKLMLVGYLENINSDRKIIEHSSLRMDVLYFLGYDIDEPLPWHSTLSRTRKLFGENVFLAFFRDILGKCVSKGMVCGKTQAVDSAFIKACASMDSLEESAPSGRELSEKSKKYFDDITANEEEPPLPKKESASDRKSKRCDAAKNKGREKYNELYRSKTDPDARVSQKPGKPAALNHRGLISVDAGSHVICAAAVDYADKKDSQTTENIMGQAIDNLSWHGIAVEEMLADTAFSSGQTYRYLESQNINAYIPVHGRYQAEREGFSYDKEADCYICDKGARLEFKGMAHNGSLRMYCSGAEDCRRCPMKEQCCKSRNYKIICHSCDKPYYDDAYEKTGTPQGRRKCILRSGTVEPVIGTLLEFRRMKKVYTKGRELAHKQLLMAAAAYNLKKLMGAMGFKKAGTAANAVKNAIFGKILAWTELFRLDCKFLAWR